MAHYNYYLSISCILVVRFLLECIKTNGFVPAIIVFGDSSVDSGNNNYISTVAKSNFRPYGRDFKFNNGTPTGRFSNGRISTDFISDAFRIKPTVPAYLDPAYNISDFSTGVCFASAGTGYDNFTSDVLSVIPLWRQLEYYKEYQKKLKTYLGEKAAQGILNEALYLISIGTNDFLENYYVFPIRPTQYSIENYQNFLIKIARNFITGLYQLGGRKISLTGLPPMGCLPLERNRNILQGGNCVENYNNVAVQFNQKLGGLVTNLNKELVGIQLVFSNPYGIFSEIIRNPKAFGFENEAKACCGTGTFEMGYMCDRFNPFTCSDADKYVFWDSFHPSEKTNSILAYDAVVNSLSIFWQ